MISVVHLLVAITLSVGAEQEQLVDSQGTKSSIQLNDDLETVELHILIPLCVFGIDKMCQK